MAAPPIPRLASLGLLGLSFALILRTFLPPGTEVVLPALETNVGFSLLAFLMTVHLVPALGSSFIKINLKGRDLLKTSGEFIPEGLGLVCAAVYIMLLTLFIPFPFAGFFVQVRDAHLNDLSKGEFPHDRLTPYLSALLSFMFATFLGLLDDLFDIPWRYKIPIPIVASIPLLLVYYADHGLTTVVMPLFVRRWFGTIVDLGPLYYLYMSLLSTFCTNSINILAGVNGIEVGQALVIAMSIALNDLLYLPWPYSIHFPGGTELGGEWGAGLARGSKDLVERHLLSLYFMLPLIGVCSGLLWHNWYPARAFPGDTFCYFSGMTIAVAGILGHFSKTLLLFFIPQIFNFILSCPQLFGIVPCPRHRLPRLDKQTMLLLPSLADFPTPPSLLANLILRTLAALHLVELTEHPTNGQILHTSNLTLPNVLLVWFGPTKENTLVKRVLILQAMCTGVAFLLRYGVAGWVYDGDRH